MRVDLGLQGAQFGILGQHFQAQCFRFQQQRLGFQALVAAQGEGGHIGDIPGQHDAGPEQQQHQDPAQGRDFPSCPGDQLVHRLVAGRLQHAQHRRGGQGGWPVERLAAAVPQAAYAVPGFRQQQAGQAAPGGQGKIDGAQAAEQFDEQGGEQGDGGPAKHLQQPIVMGAFHGGQHTPSASTARRCHDERLKCVMGGVSSGGSGDAASAADRRTTC